jgi:hypothetical protein
MDKNRVLEALKTLRAELADVSDVDEASRESLARVTDDIERQLQAGKPLGPEESESLSGRLQDALLEFEAEHPQITGAVNQVAAALANLGI